MNEKETIHLADIAGYHEEKEEAVKLIDVLQNFDQYRKEGASVPKGLILCGEPGVGKTMFAKAISTEAGVPLYEFESGESENDEEAVKGIKELFASAKKAIPSIVFIDELDELVSSTDMGGLYGYQSDYSRKALKTLLTEIDGVSSSDGILVIATTNSKGTIPAPLIRSGRLEKQITFDVPSFSDRAEIAALYLNKANATGVDPLDIAKKTDGFTGADIKSLINGAIIESVRGKKPLSIEAIETVIPTIRFGEIKKKTKGGPSDVVCYHEIGHFLVQYGLSGEIGRLSVESYGQYAGRMELEDEEENKTTLKSVDELLDSVTVSLGGMAGEEAFLGKRYCGSDSDISNATKALVMVIASGAFGFSYLPAFLYSSRMGSGITRFSVENPEGARKQSAKIVELLEEKFALALRIVRQYKGIGEAIYPLLKKKESLSKEELTRIVEEYKEENRHEAIA